jgi:hypothetical protein
MVVPAVTVVPAAPAVVVVSVQRGRLPSYRVVPEVWAERAARVLPVV